MSEDGRPLKFPDVKKLQAKINKYFRDCDPHPVWEKYIGDKTDIKGNVLEENVVLKRRVMSEQKPYLITGLAVALDTSRQTLINYEEREEFFDTIKAAKMRCQDYAASRLFTGNATGAIFVLKNNYAWKDTKEVDQTIRGLKLGDLYDAATGERPNEQKEDEIDS